MYIIGGKRGRCIIFHCVSANRKIDSADLEKSTEENYTKTPRQCGTETWPTQKELLGGPHGFFLTPVGITRGIPTR